MSTIKHKEAHKLYGIYDDDTGSLITEGDISNQSSDVPWLKCKANVDELEQYVDDHEDHNLQVVSVVIHLEAIVKTPK